MWIKTCNQLTVSKGDSFSYVAVPHTISWKALRVKLRFPWRRRNATSWVQLHFFCKSELNKLYIHTHRHKPVGYSSFLETSAWYSIKWKQEEKTEFNRILETTHNLQDTLDILQNTSDINIHPVDQGRNRMENPMKGFMGQALFSSIDWDLVTWPHLSARNHGRAVSQEKLEI